MTADVQARQRGRPRRKSAPTKIRYTLPDGHPLESVLAGLTPAEAGVRVVSLATAFHQGKAPAAIGSSLTPAASATPAQSIQVLEVDDDFFAATALGQED